MAFDNIIIDDEKNWNNPAVDCNGSVYVTSFHDKRNGKKYDFYVITEEGNLEPSYVIVTADDDYMSAPLSCLLQIPHMHEVYHFCIVMLCHTGKFTWSKI